MLAFSGTHGYTGGAQDLDVVKATPARLSMTKLRVETALIDGADHMYTGEEAQVARVIDG